jgi:hypothetical protein
VSNRLPHDRRTEPGRKSFVRTEAMTTWMQNSELVDRHPVHHPWLEPLLFVVAGAGPMRQPAVQVELSM